MLYAGIGGLTPVRNAGNSYVLLDHCAKPIPADLSWREIELEKLNKELRTNVRRLQEDLKVKRQRNQQLAIKCKSLSVRLASPFPPEIDNMIITLLEANDKVVDDDLHMHSRETAFPYPRVSVDYSPSSWEDPLRRWM